MNASNISLSKRFNDMQILHEAYQFLTKRYVDNATMASERTSILTNQRKKAETLEIVKAKPIHLGSLLDMPSG